MLVLDLTVNWSITKEINAQTPERATTCVEDGAGPLHKSHLKMDTTRQKKTWEAKNHLAQNCETRAGTVMSWGEAPHAARGRMQWRVLTEALCPIADEKE